MAGAAGGLAGPPGRRLLGRHRDRRPRRRLDRGGAALPRAARRLADHVLCAAVCSFGRRALRRLAVPWRRLVRLRHRFLRLRTRCLRCCARLRGRLWYRRLAAFCRWLCLRLCLRFQLPSDSLMRRNLCKACVNRRYYSRDEFSHRQYKSAFWVRHGGECGGGAVTMQPRRPEWSLLWKPRRYCMCGPARTRGSAPPAVKQCIQTVSGYCTATRKTCVQKGVSESFHGWLLHTPHVTAAWSGITQRAQS